MKKVKVVLQTDGDFSVLGKTDLDFSKTDYEYIFEFITKDVYTDLSKILCDIHISYTHEYLIPHLYEFFHKAMNNSHLDNYYDTYNGNYEGTLIEWVESEEEE